MPVKNNDWIIKRDWVINEGIEPIEIQGLIVLALSAGMNLHETISEELGKIRPSKFDRLLGYSARTRVLMVQTSVKPPDIVTTYKEVVDELVRIIKL